MGPDHDYTAYASYSIGALYAAEGQKAAAIAELKHAIDHGLTADSCLNMQTDTQLKSLKGDPDFNAVLADARQHAAAQAAK